MISVTVSVFITEAVGVRSLCRNVIDQFRILRIDGLDAKRSVFVRGTEERIFVDSESLNEFFGNVVGKFEIQFHMIFLSFSMASLSSLSNRVSCLARTPSSKVL